MGSIDDKSKTGNKLDEKLTIRDKMTQEPAVDSQIRADHLRELLGLGDGRKIVLFIARGSPGNRWFQGKDGKWSLKDEYAENMPEALISLTKRIGWKLVVVFAGQQPEYDESRLSYSQLYQHVKVCDLTDIGFLMSRYKNGVQPQFEKVCTDLEKRGDFDNIFSYRGVKFSHHIIESVRKDIPRLATTHVGMTTLWSHFFNFVQAEVLFAGRLDVSPYITAAARACALKTVNIKLGIGEEMLPPFAVKNAAGVYDLAAVPDVSLVWGEWQKELIESRFPGYPSKIVVSGRTRNDSFVAPVSSVVKDELREILNIPASHNVVTYGASFLTKFGMGDNDLSGLVCLSESAYRQGLQAIMRVMDEVENLSVLVKPHPVDDLDLLQSIADEFGSSVKFLTPNSGYHNQTILSISDIFVSSVSSMFSEAIGAKCLPVNLWVDDVNYLYEKKRNELWSNLAYSVGSFDELSSSLLGLLVNPKERNRLLETYAKNLPRFVGRFDGKNSKRGALDSFKALSINKQVPFFNLRTLGY